MTVPNPLVRFYHAKKNSKDFHCAEKNRNPFLKRIRFSKEQLNFCQLPKWVLGTYNFYLVIYRTYIPLLFSASFSLLFFARVDALWAKRFNVRSNLPKMAE